MLISAVFGAKRIVLQCTLLSLPLLFLTSCSKILNPETIATEIQQAIIKQGGNSLKTVTCPKNIAIAVGNSFECLAELDTGDAFVIPVKQTNETGKLEWQVPNAKGLLNLTMLETVFQQTIQTDEGKTLAIDCGKGYRAVRPGESFECKVKPPAAKPTQSSQAIATKAESAKPAQRSSTTKAKQSAPLPQAILVTIDPESNVNWRQVIAAAPAVTNRVNQQPASSPDPTDQAPLSTNPALIPQSPSVRTNLPEAAQKDIEQRFD